MHLLTVQCVRVRACVSKLEKPNVYQEPHFPSLAAGWGRQSLFVAASQAPPERSPSLKIAPHPSGDHSCLERSCSHRQVKHLPAVDCYHSCKQVIFPRHQGDAGKAEQMLHSCRAVSGQLNSREGQEFNKGERKRGTTRYNVGKLQSKTHNITAQVSQCLAARLIVNIDSFLIFNVSADCVWSLWSYKNTWHSYELHSVV